MQPQLRSTIDVTPLIGLLLALVPAVAIALPAQRNQLRIDMPCFLRGYPGPDVPKPYGVWPHTITLDANGRFEVAMPKGVLVGDTLEDVVRSVPRGAEIIVRAEADTPYEAFASLVNGLNRHGFVQLRLVNVVHD